jgi:EpsI family protein
VSSDNALVVSTDPNWSRTAGGERQVVFNGRPITVNTADLRSRNGKRLVVWYWYWVAGTYTASDYRAKAYTAVSRLRGGGDDSAVIILYAPKRDDGSAIKSLQLFSADAGPTLENALVRARASR